MTESPENKYGTTPYSPNHMHSLGEEPRSATLTKTLIWPLLVLNLITAIIGLLAFQAAGTAQYLEQNLPPGELESFTPDMLDGVTTALVVFFIVIAVINVALFVVVGLGLRANRNWARFLGLVFAILFLLSAVYSLLIGTNYGNLSGLEILNSIISWLTVLLTIWWITQAMNKETTRWFALHRNV